MRKNLTWSRLRIKNKVRKKVRWTSECPRMSVYKSNRFVFVQVIDDESSRTLCALRWAKTVKSAEEMWKSIAWMLKTDKICFDRNWYKYHWIVKSLADWARAAWINF